MAENKSSFSSWRCVPFQGRRKREGGDKNWPLSPPVQTPFSLSFLPLYGIKIHKLPTAPPAAGQLGTTIDEGRLGMSFFAHKGRWNGDGFFACPPPAEFRPASAWNSTAFFAIWWLFFQYTGENITWVPIVISSSGDDSVAAQLAQMKLEFSRAEFFLLFLIYVHPLFGGGAAAACPSDVSPPPIMQKRIDAPRSVFLFPLRQQNEEIKCK